MRGSSGIFSSMFSSSKSSQAAKPQAGASAAGPGLSAQERELVTAESKRLGQRVHQLFNGGNYREALQVAEEQMELLKNAYGPNHHEYATAMNNVATLYQALGRYAEAEPNPNPNPNPNPTPTPTPNPNPTLTLTRCHVAEPTFLGFCQAQGADCAVKTVAKLHAHES